MVIAKNIVPRIANIKVGRDTTAPDPNAIQMVNPFIPDPERERRIAEEDEKVYGGLAPMLLGALDADQPTANEDIGFGQVPKTERDASMHQ